MKKSEPLVVVEHAFNCPVTDLWLALTERERMIQWYFADIPAFEPRVGFRTEFMVDAGERQFLDQWEITEVVPEQKIAYRWRYDGYRGAAQSVFELSGDANASHLRVSFPVEEDFQENVPEFNREACLGGWNYFIKEQLAAYLAC